MSREITRRESESNANQRSRERLPLLSAAADNQPLNNYASINIPADQLSELERQGCCQRRHGKILFDIGKLAIYCAKRFGQDLAVHYSAFVLATQFNENLESPQGYYGVIGATLLTTLEDSIYQGKHIFSSNSAKAKKWHEGFRILVNGEDACFAAGLFIGSLNSDDDNFQTGASIAGLGIGIANIAVNLLDHAKSGCTQGHEKAVNAARIAVNTVSQFCVAAGALELLTFFIDEVDFEGNGIEIPDNLNIAAQSVMGAAFAAMALAASLKHSHRLHEIPESFLHGMIYMMMGTIFSFNAYTSSETNDSISDAYGYSMMALFALTTLLFYGYDIKQHWQHEHHDEHAQDPANQDDLEANLSESDSADSDDDNDAANENEDDSDYDIKAIKQPAECQQRPPLPMPLQAPAAPIPLRQITSQIKQSKLAGTLFTLPREHHSSSPSVQTGYKVGNSFAI